tara:strand:- start:1126 stop:1347 length:222 start_codon:yes stop_codon:yes gene_type:complete
MFSKFQFYASDQMSQTHHKITGLHSLHFYSLLRQVKILFQTVAQISFQLSILDFALPREYANRSENPFLEDID